VRVPGYCTECHRIKQVNVSGHGLAMGAASGVFQGVCWNCEDAADKKRREAQKPKETR
jgi:hypothetical protein